MLFEGFIVVVAVARPCLCFGLCWALLSFTHGQQQQYEEFGEGERFNPHGRWDMGPRKNSDITTRMKIRGSVVSYEKSFICPHPPEVEKKKKKI